MKIILLSFIEIGNLIGVCFFNTITYKQGSEIVALKMLRFSS
jgi:hypothetical protein